MAQDRGFRIKVTGPHIGKTFDLMHKATFEGLVVLGAAKGTHDLIAWTALGHERIAHMVAGLIKSHPETFPIILKELEGK